SAKHWGDLKSIPAVREGRVYAYPSNKILRPGPRGGEGLEEIARFIHPECFAESRRGLKNGRECEGSRPQKDAFGKLEAGGFACAIHRWLYAARTGAPRPLAGFGKHILRQSRYGNSFSRAASPRSPGSSHWRRHGRLWRCASSAAAQSARLPPDARSFGGRFF